jgi:hypothetical protein
MLLTFIELATIIASLTLWVYFNDKFSIKSTFLKVTGDTFIGTDSPTLISSLILSMSTFLSINFSMQKINALKVNR